MASSMKPRSGSVQAERTRPLVEGARIIVALVPDRGTAREVESPATPEALGEREGTLCGRGLRVGLRLRLADPAHVGPVTFRDRLARSVALAGAFSHGSRPLRHARYGQLAGAGARFAVNALPASNLTVPPNVAQ